MGGDEQETPTAEAAEARRVLTMIIPTVGRIVWYRPYANSPEQAAIVCDVSSDGRSLNLAVFDPDGSLSPMTNIRLIQDGEAPLDDGRGYCEWMPYQKGQAAKTEQLEKTLTEKVGGEFA